ncbi:polysaccharide pyruvyl transferase family protein [Thalassotalea sp. 1_MG-2023]|uniref:polysaccharide pyruvyl transferase family protein n=1 Tax=Thalassotalea sp. 1_MG-2023 TaxID=3062680 RepID=UPI0026E225BB|nr:polysaccharide pyruvyl transferase family protein [Thalassotalea sp. 1_MG-2023]MDO6426509.1 polysaccharide pyruvyl transferase family protein [Thalassotalea sp. 1_MG-2023]
MFIEIKGVQFVNKGAELMLASVVERVKQYWPEAEIVLEGNPFSPYKSRAMLGAFQKLSLRKNVLDLNFIAYYLPNFIRNYLKKWGVVTEADIDVVLDAAGFAYGDQWGALKIKHLGGELKRYKKNGCKYIFLPQALGPFTRSEDIKVLKNHLPKAALICAREQQSYDNIRDIIGDASNLIQYPDFTNAVKGVVPDYWQDGDTKVCFIPNSNMIGDKNQNESWKKNYLDIMKLLMEKTQELGLVPVLLNHEGDGDRDICEKLNSFFDNKLEVIEESDPLKVKGIIGASKAIVCSRFHGCVSALSQSIPNLGTSWSHKYEQLFNEYIVPELLINPNSSKDDLERLLDDVINNNTEYLANINSSAKKFKAITEDMWLTVCSKIKER